MSYFRLLVNSISHQNLPLSSFAKANNKNNFSRNGKRFIMAAAATNFLSPSQISATVYVQPSLCGGGRGGQVIQIRNFSSLQSKQGLMAVPNNQRRNFNSYEITKNLTLCSDQPRNVKFDPATLRLEQPIDKPLVVMLSWLLGKKKHIFKYAKIYTDQGYDVMTVEITPWQLLWPPKGSQLVTADVLSFLENNKSYSPIVLHGFSVGAYVWGECMVQMARDMNRYGPAILDRIAAQIWDSAADITEIPVGVPKSIFPKNPTLQKALRNYCLYHLKTFHEQATIHYIRSSQIFHSTLVKAPALFFLSKTDPIGAENSNRSVCNDYESAGVKCTWICWDRSPHVSHFMVHKDEYLQYLYKHLETNVMERLSEKSRAKL